MKFEGFSTENRRLVQVITTTADNLLSDITELHEDRLASRGGHFTREQMLPVYFTALVGTPRDEAEYKNTLFNLRDTLIRSPKLLIYIENELKPPTEQELEYVKNNELIIRGDELRTELARKELAAPLLEGGGGEAVGGREAARLITWLYRCVSHPDYQKSLPQIPVLLYYGAIGEQEVEFLHFMSKIGMDVIYIGSDRSALGILRKNNIEGRMQIFDLPYSKPVTPYPDKLTKAKFATTAYRAERQLDTVLYDSSVIFRDFQFKKACSRTLKTTFEEIDILWHQPAKLRSGFEVINNERAIVPTLFVKISGVRDGNMSAYWDSLRFKLSPNAKIIRKTPAMPITDFTRLFTDYKSFFYGKEIYIDKLKASPFNNYKFLSDPLQDHIFEKMQEAADINVLKLDPVDLMLTIIHVGLNIDRDILKVLQRFDYTKDIPKIIVIDVIEDVFSKTESVQLLLYNLLCFDIAVFTPTGYRNLEQYVNEAAYETYIMNEFVHKVSVPGFKLPSTIPTLSGKSNRLFRKGRK